jgi:hypothetical protein
MTDKPLWVGVQSYKKPKEGNRYPNPTEYRAQAYIAMAHGAKGLMWYGGSVTGGVYIKPDEGNWDYLKKLATELKDMAPVFMGKTEAAPKFSPETAPVSVMLKKAGDRTVLIAVNRGGKPAELTLTSAIDQRGHREGAVRTADVSATAGKLSDKFEPYAVHVLRTVAVDSLPLSSERSEGSRVEVRHDPRSLGVPRDDTSEDSDASPVCVSLLLFAATAFSPGPHPDQTILRHRPRLGSHPQPRDRRELSHNQAGLRLHRQIEIGGVISRTRTPAYYAMKIPPLSMSTPMSASGKIRIMPTHEIGGA